ncbi:hypothetical protein P8C59_007485 [Phyllachora maydis]|uniref:Uncharacterized protein n=1 Tax=Phyllachora maydis TaxID=1825666 RepID=A0AAD9ME95_9PEZI|nr:hypothetical protein P8C59_007485 [Phyllachora maydis]
MHLRLHLVLAAVQMAWARAVFPTATDLKGVNSLADGACSREQQTMFLDELKTVKEIAEYLVLHHNDYHGAYFRAFFPSNREGSAAAAALFDNIARAADPQDTSKEFRRPI